MTNTAVFRGKGQKVGFLFSMIEIYNDNPNTKHIIIPPKWWQIDPRHELRIQNISMLEWESTRLELYKSFGPKVTAQIF